MWGRRRSGTASHHVDVIFLRNTLSDLEEPAFCKLCRCNLPRPRSTGFIECSRCAKHVRLCTFWVRGREGDVARKSQHERNGFRLSLVVVAAASHPQVPRSCIYEKYLQKYLQTNSTHNVPHTRRQMDTQYANTNQAYSPSQTQTQSPKHTRTRTSLSRPSTRAPTHAVIRLAHPQQLPRESYYAPVNGVEHPGDHGVAVAAAELGKLGQEGQPRVLIQDAVQKPLPVPWRQRGTLPCRV